MGLAQLQSALARLYVDENFRHELSESGNVGTVAGLSPAEREELLSLTRKDSRLAQFSESLIHKRRGEVAKLLPATARLLAAEFKPLFREFAVHWPLYGRRKHTTDAIAFARYVARHPSFRSRPWAQEIARFEADCLSVSLSARPVTLHLYRFRVHHLIQEALESDQPQSLRPRKTFVLWYRHALTKEMRFIFFGQ